MIPVRMKLYMLALILMALVLRLTRCDENMPSGPHHVKLRLGVESGPHTTLCNQYGYFEIVAINACDDIHIELHHVEGQPNLYVGKAPNYYPKYNSLTWSSYDWAHDKVVLSSWDPEFVMGTYYISVHAYCGDDVGSAYTPAKYTLLATSKRHDHPATDDMFNTTKSGRLTQQKYIYYRACLPSPCYKMRVNLQNCIDYKACPDHYAYPELLVSRSKEKPTIHDHSWKLADTKVRYIDLDAGTDLAVSPGHYYIGIYGWCTPDEHCEDEETCGPCHTVAQAPYNLSVRAIPTSNERCDEFTAAAARAASAAASSRLTLHRNILIAVVTLAHCHRLLALA